MIDDDVDDVIADDVDDVIADDDDDDDDDVEGFIDIFFVFFFKGVCAQPTQLPNTSKQSYDSKTIIYFFTLLYNASLRPIYFCFATSRQSFEQIKPSAPFSRQFSSFTINFPSQTIVYYHFLKRKRVNRIGFVFRMNFNVFFSVPLGCRQSSTI